MTGQFEDPAWVDLALTPRLPAHARVGDEDGVHPVGDRRASAGTRPTGSPPSAPPTACASSATTLIWYSQDTAFFRALDPRAFRAPSTTATSRPSHGAIAAARPAGTWSTSRWPRTETACATCLWSEALGQDGYIVRAFEQAEAADPDAVLFLNDYNLENLPTKGATFLRLVERLLKAGVPIGGIGTQSHLDIEIPAGQTAAFFREAAQFGLPIHVSELDASLRSEGRIDTRSQSRKIEQQTARVAELTDAFMALPPAQRFAFTVWGMRDTDSWLRRDARDDGKDSPLLFDATGRPNPMFQAVAEAVRQSR